MTALHTPGASRLEVPFTLHRDYLPLVEATIGPKRNLVLLLDTGSGRTIINNSVATSLGLQGRATVLGSFGERIRAEEAVIPELWLGSYPAGKQEVVVTDLAATAATIGLPRLDGIVGVDVLGQTSFAIDYAHGRLHFGPPAATPFRTPLIKHPVFLVVSARADRRRVNLILDSGASHLVLIDPAERTAPHSGEAEVMSHVAGSTVVRRVLIKELHIGHSVRRDVAAVSMPPAAVETADTDGLLGLRALGANFVQFDLERQQLGMQRIGQ